MFIPAESAAFKCMKVGGGGVGERLETEKQKGFELEFRRAKYSAHNQVKTFFGGIWMKVATALILFKNRRLQPGTSVVTEKIFR